MNTNKKAVKKVKDSHCVGIALKGQSYNTVLTAYDSYPVMCKMGEIEIVGEKPTFTEFCRIMLVSKCHEFNQKTKKEG